MDKEFLDAKQITICTPPGQGTAIEGQLVWRGDVIDLTNGNRQDAWYLVQNGQAELGAKNYNDPAPAAAAKTKAVDPASLAQK